MPSGERPTVRKKIEVPFHVLLAVFGAVIMTSTVVMFILMYLNTYAIEHLFWSETRTYMAIMMGRRWRSSCCRSCFRCIPAGRSTAAIFIGAVVVFAASLWLVRSQETVQDRSFMRAMIPHHSIAIHDVGARRDQRCAGRQARARDPIGAERARYRKCAISSPEIGRAGEVDEIYEDPGLSVGSLEDALSSTRMATLDPAPLSLDDLPEAPGRRRSTAGSDACAAKPGALDQTMPAD